MHSGFAHEAGNLAGRPPQSPLKLLWPVPINAVLPEAGSGFRQHLRKKKNRVYAVFLFLFLPVASLLLQYFYEASGAVDPDLLAILDFAGSPVDAYDSRDAILTGDDGSMGHQTAYFSDKAGCERE